MLKPKLFLIATTAIILQSCNGGETGRKAMENYLASADTIAMSEAGLANLASDERYVIRKADVRCRVADVQDAVAQLENFVAMAGGFVQESHTSNRIVRSKAAAYRNDSVKTAQVYQPTADMVIRVPFYALDTLADEINRIASFIDHRNMTREDVTLSFISNVLKNEQPGTANTAPAKPATAREVTANQYADNKHERHVDRRIANLSMLEDSRYATLKLQLYQPEQVVLFITQDADKMVAAGFGEKIVKSLGYGMDIVKGLILILVTVWPLWILAAIVIIIFRKRLRKTISGTQLG